jgi:hypothetical protein
VKKGNTCLSGEQLGRCDSGAAQQVAEADVLIEVRLDADFGSESFCGLLGASCHPHAA